MFRTSIRWTAVLTSIVGIVLGPAAQSDACFGWLERWRERRAAASPACVAQPTCAPQVVNYVPQTAYRTQYVSVPVTSYRPTASYDATTGCPVTCMRPVTTYCTQARLVPYTTYRLQYSNPCAAAAPMVASTYYQPQTSYQPTTTFQPQPTMGYAAPSGCSSCSQGGGATFAAPTTQAYSIPSQATTSYAPITSPPQVAMPSTTYAQAPAANYSQQPTTTYAQSPTTQGTVAYPPSTQYPGPTTYSSPSRPSIPMTPTTPSTGSSAPKTFEQNGSNTNTNGTNPGTGTPAGGMKPIEDPLRTTPAHPMSGPGLIDPRSRTTSMPVYRAGAYSTVSWPQTAAVHAPIAQLAPAITPDTQVMPATYQVPNQYPTNSAVSPAQFQTPANTFAPPAGASDWKPSRR